MQFQGKGRNRGGDGNISKDTDRMSGPIVEGYKHQRKGGVKDRKDSGAIVKFMRTTETQISKERGIF